MTGQGWDFLQEITERRLPGGLQLCSPSGGGVESWSHGWSYEAAAVRQQHGSTVMAGHEIIPQYQDKEEQVS